MPSPDTAISLHSNLLDPLLAVEHVHLIHTFILLHTILQAFSTILCSLLSYKTFTPFSKMFFILILLYVLKFCISFKKQFKWQFLQTGYPECSLSLSHTHTHTPHFLAFHFY